ncbi:hypothetical protein CPB84DRAFT_1781939 [Gymnopilus junonius]|uniref:Uncharacterized protein n=1 Tax=Gymnopilus junonius TaxID=109634 RepID=A0A9P5NKL6_GYMJU|nr:hypothetical protein CPB84DRAFT_1781939 [Gymnopilus junonius]
MTASAPSPTTEGPTLTAPPRRTRPVLGLGSRQFEAALSGVAGLARERSQAQAQAQNAGGGDGSAASPSTSTVPPAVPIIQYARIDGSDTEKPASPASPPSPKKTRRGGRGGGGPVQSGSAEVPQVKVPSILQRADAPPPGMIQREALNATNAVLPNLSTQVGANPTGTNPRGGGGGRRGRGGGRGRGGLPITPRGG